MSIGSLNAFPSIVNPAGSEPCVNPIGTVIAGKPVCGERIWLLSPAGPQLYDRRDAALDQQGFGSCCGRRRSGSS
jgi:hypothetical protein